MAIAKLALKSLYNRRGTAILTVFAIALSVTLLLGVERVRTQTKENFANTLSGTDLIVGARTGQVQLLLYSVFRIGNATNNISWQTYQEIANDKAVKWTVPFSLGDSHRGFRVLGTTPDYFKYYRFGQKQHLNFHQGQSFGSPIEAVLGAEVAKKLNYQLGQEIVIAHGSSDVSFTKHDNLPFKVVGILDPTGTPVDRTVHVSLAGIEAIHFGWQNGAPRGGQLQADQLDQVALEPEVITAFLVGLKSKMHTFALQRKINEYQQEAIMAVLPGVALQELWSTMSMAENALLVVSGFVVVSGLLGMLTTLLTSLNERRREMAILRSVGARPGHIFSLLISEAGLLALAGALTGVSLLYGLILIIRPIAMDMFGIYVRLSALTQYELILLSIVVISGFIIGLFPAWRAYRMSLADGMTIRI
ncbi:ABC transporter permease [Motilimonas cestriensis]|uniref:ABC transporter permease n=1 Tax=Motilimonas cestriensis TaxID=2742685 RepID=A0ABS8WGL7_9GAMM|nr:FtsX-like permease family protein [Motilimonas cestriensis]MCE2596510.1 ABC transporter permease [Motilimonas cestriensis]